MTVLLAMACYSTEQIMWRPTGVRSIQFSTIGTMPLENTLQYNSASTLRPDEANRLLERDGRNWRQLS